MKVAYVHVLPLELYPPARNLLVLMSNREGWEVRAWSTSNDRGMGTWGAQGVRIDRHSYPGEKVPVPIRMAGYAAWHMKTAAELARWKPDVVMMVEPHSSLAVWLYYRLFRGSARLFIHHHEYYAPEDFNAPGMRLLRSTLGLERNYLFPRAEWVSQTNSGRLDLLQSWNRQIQPGAARVFPNYPPREWVTAANAVVTGNRSGPTRFVYVGSASFEDTYIREVCEWAAAQPETVSLHVVGHNVRKTVWESIQSLGAANITSDPAGVAYDELPSLLRHFDVGLVLYRGNTLNFVHIVPNKAIEYLACGLEVWYPGRMHGLRNFHRDHPDLRLKEMNFQNLEPYAEAPEAGNARAGEFEFIAETAAEPLLSLMTEAGEANRR